MFIAIPIEGARQSRTGKIPEKGSANRKYLTKAVWLNNNKLTDIKNLEVLVDSILEQPLRLGWVDFSFNQITNIDEVHFMTCFILMFLVASVFL